jgi:thymidylate kinase
MALYYVTGISGSGKSSVRDELRRRGYEAYGTDEDSLAYFYHNQTGERVKSHVAVEERTPEWRAQHTWKLPRAKAEELAKNSQGKKMFLCGVTANDADELWDLFTKVFALFVDEETLKHRIKNRTENDFGKSEHEFQTILEWQQTAKEDYRKLGAALIDASRPLNEVVNEIIAQV